MMERAERIVRSEVAWTHSISYNSIGFLRKSAWKKGRKERGNQRKIIKKFLDPFACFSCPPNCITYNLKDTQGEERGKR
jgi:hypothetical protein